MAYTFAELLRGYRTRAGLTQRQLAEQIGVSLKTVTNWETGNWPPKQPEKAVSAIVEALGLGDTERTALVTAWLHGTSDGEPLVAESGGPPPPPHPQIRPPDSAGIVGRELELAGITRLLRARRAALLTGPPGVGKTTLAAAACARALADERLIFWHRCRPGQGLEVIIWRLAGFLFHRGHDLAWKMLHQPAYASGAQPLEVVADTLLAQLSGRGFLLCLDDMHLVEGSEPAVELLGRLLDLVGAGRLSLLGTTRYELRWSWPNGAPEHVQVAGLLKEEATSWIMAQAPPLAPELAQDLAVRTAGNPQLILLGLASLQKARNHAALLARLATADDVQTYLLREVDATMTPPARAVMGAIACLQGYPAARGAIEAMLDGRSVARPLNELVRRGLVQSEQAEREPLYAQHAIYQEFFYDLLDAPERLALSERAARYFEQRGELLMAIRQYVRCGAGASAAALAARSVRRSIGSGGAQQLLALLREIDLAQLPEKLQAEVNIAVGELAVFLREPILARERLLVALEQLERHPTWQSAHALQSRIYRGMGELLEPEEPQEALGWLQRGLTLVAGGLEESLLRLRVGSVQIVLGNYEQALAMLEGALASLPATAGYWRARALLSKGVVLCAQGDPAAGYACYDEALSLYVNDEDEWGVMSVWQNLGIEKQIAGDWPDAAAEYQRALDLAKKLGSVVHQTDLNLCIGVLLTNRGDGEAARESFRRSLELAERHRLNEQAIHIYSSLADLLVREGEVEGAAEAMERAQRLVALVGPTYMLPELERGRALIALARNDPAGAVALATRAVDLASAMESALEEGMGLRVLGECLYRSGQAAAALEALARSASMLDEQDPYEAARADLARAEVSCGNGDVEEGLAALTSAEATFGRLGARRELAAARALRKQCGGCDRA